MKKNIREYRGAVFDLDGTLIDSMWVWDGLCRDWLVEKGKSPGADLEQTIEIMTLTQSAEYVIRRFGIDHSPEEILAQWNAIALDRYKNEVPLKAGMAELIRKLHKNGVKLAVATSCFPEACEAVLRRYGLRDLFSAILYTDEAPGDKGDPRIWLAAAERIGLPPEDCVVFEDLYKALGGVRSAGMGFAAVYDKTCTDWKAMKAEADYVYGPEFFTERTMNKTETKPQASLAIQVLPQSVSGDELLRIVDAVIAYIKSTGLTIFVGPFETAVEGEFDRLMEIARECQLICIREGAPELLTYMKMAYKPGAGVWSIEEKTAKYHDHG
jgi:HAD superfamily hydrolase (TIGR01509 family)